jgi:hypothetical protein
VIGLSIKTVELVNDYEISLKENTYDLVKSNERLLNALSKENEIQSEDDIFPSYLIDACVELNINYSVYLEEVDVIKITLEDDSIHTITNLDIAVIWDGHEYCEEMVCNWYDNYLMLTATDARGQDGIMAIYDVSLKSWIYNEREPHMRGMIYAPEINKFIGLYDIAIWTHNGYGITMLDPENGFSQEDVSFEAHGNVIENGEQVDVDRSSYRVDSIDSEIGEDEEIVGCVIDEDTMMLWNGKNRCVYLEKGDRTYRYCVDYN